jgi:hypothetical protein
MAEVINLNRYRKAKARTDAVRTAEANRIRTGRTKEQKRRDEMEKGRRAKELDDKKLE